MHSTPISPAPTTHNPPTLSESPPEPQPRGVGSGAGVEGQRLGFNTNTNCGPGTALPGSIHESGIFSPGLAVCGHGGDGQAMCHV